MAKKGAPAGYLKGKWTKEAIQFLNERYLARDLRGRVVETPEGMCFRVAKEIASVEKKFSAVDQEVEKLTTAFYELMVQRWFMPNSPTLMNAGRDNNLQFSACFVLPVGDSLVEIFNAIRNAALIHQSGGGTGFDFSRLRPRGSIVRSTRGVASGPVSFMEVFDAATASIKQGGMRRGANMGILRVDHPDILEFITSKAKKGMPNFNISVAATDKFMEAVKNNSDYWLYDPFLKRKTKKLKAREVFETIIKMAWQTGDPGMVFIDRINAGSASPVPSMGPIEATNPCIAGSCLVSSEVGLLPMERLIEEGEKIRVLTDNRVLGGDGVKIRSHAHLYKRGKKKVFRLITKSGFELLTTPDHKIATANGWVPLRKLTPKDEVLIQVGAGSWNKDNTLPLKSSFETFPKNWSQKLGRILGWLVGDGWLREGDKNRRVGFSFAEEDKQILKLLKPIINTWYGSQIKEVKRENGIFHLSYHGKGFVKFFQELGVQAVKAEEKGVPTSLFSAPKEAVIGFLQGLFTADGTVGFVSRHSAYIRLTAKSKKLLQEVQLLLLNLGIFSKIYNRSRPSAQKFSYQTIKGEKRNYSTDGILWELEISRDQVLPFLKEVGFLENKHQKKIKKLKSHEYYKTTFSDRVVSVVSAGYQPVFDLTEPVSHSFIANGIVVSNCGEQPLYPNEACNLGSINLSLMIKEGKKNIDWERLKSVVRLTVRFLDNVAEVSPFPLPEITQAVKLNRRIGLGVMGWADMLFQLEIPYDSPQALNLAKKIMKFIQKEAHLESQRLAKERGPFPNFKKSIYKDDPPLRNATLTTIAPSGSISVIAGCSSGIEPLFALCFKHRANGRELTFVNPYFQQVIKRLKIPEAVWEKVKVLGKLEGIEEIPPKIKKVFMTAHEISWQDHIHMQAAFQTGVDNAVSKTINLPHEASVDDVRNAYLLAYKLGCLGITVFRDGCKEQQVLYAGEPKVTWRELIIKPRPPVAAGKTYRVSSPVGTAFVTVNTNGHGEPLEVFVNVGKAGSDISADAEAIGRLISLTLRLGSEFHPDAVLSQIIDQLGGIGGSESVGFGKNKVRSLADGIAIVLKDYVEKRPPLAEVNTIGEQPSLLTVGRRRDLCPACGQARLVFEEGCAKCTACGYNKC